MSSFLYVSAYLCKCGLGRGTILKKGRLPRTPFPQDFWRIRLPLVAKRRDAHEVLEYLHSFVAGRSLTIAVQSPIRNRMKDTAKGRYTKRSANQLS